MKNIPHIKDVKVSGKRVFLRCDLNVPLGEWANITDDTRIRASMRTIQFLLDNGAKVVISSHLGRPKGAPDPDFSLKPVAKDLSAKLGFDVPLVKDYFEGEIPVEIRDLKSGKAVLLENLRFHPGETKNDAAFYDRLASFADIYVNDAFGTCHRAHASVVGIAERLPHYAGFLIFDEVENLSKLLEIEDKERPFVVVLGGKKVSDKIGVIKQLFDRVDTILIGGGMAFTYLKAAGHSVGLSVIDEEYIGAVPEFMQRAQEAGVKIELPVDLIIAENNSENADFQISGVDIEDPLWLGMDIGPKTVNKFRGYLVNARTVFMNGPMGVFEYKSFESGTVDILRVIASSNSYSVLGGGDTAAAAAKFNLTPRFSHVSTGGGASLEFLSGIDLPGVAALRTPNP